MKIIISGGGTGGHLFPALAIANELKERVRELEIQFVGTEKGIETRLVPREDFILNTLKVEGFVGKSFKEKMRALFLFLMTLIKSIKIIKSIKPNIVIGVGGYASVNIVLAGWMKKIPTMILEQNIVPGLANKFLSKIVDAIAVTYQESISFFPPEKTFLTGNPIRKNIFTKDKKKALSLFPIDNNKFTIFIFGGSSGARGINNKIIESLKYLSDLKDKIQFIHQTGVVDISMVDKAYKQFNFTSIVKPFIYNMADAYLLADIVICRAGATTLAELTVLGKAAILIPYPYAVSNHQEINAKKLKDINAAIVIPEKILTGEILSRSILKLYKDPDFRLNIERNSSLASIPNATQRVVDIALNLAKRY